jgi:hypothetical protein
MLIRYLLTFPGGLITMELPIVPVYYPSSFVLVKLKNTGTKLGINTYSRACPLSDIKRIPDMAVLTP